MATRTRRSGRSKSNRPGSRLARETNPWRDHWVLVAIPKPFAKTMRRWRRFKQRFARRVNLLFWFSVAAIIVYSLVR